MLLELLTINIRTVLLFCTVFLTIYWLLNSRKNGVSFPTGIPGPPSIPIFGSMLFMPGKTLEESICKWASKYGDIYLMYLFTRPVVIINGWDAIKDTLIRRGDVFSERPDGFITEYVFKGHGVVNASGRRWKEQRRFTISALRDFGMGRNSMEGKIIEEVKVLLAVINKEANLLDPTIIIGKCVSNIIHSIVFGERKELDDPQFERFLRQFRINVQAVRTAGVIEFFPWLRFIPGDPFKFHALVNSLSELEVYIQQHMNEHKKTYDPEKITDFIYAYLKEQKYNEDNDESTFSDFQLLKLVGNLFIAGSETTATTIRWTLYYLIVNQDVQKKLQDEIDEVVGCSRLPSIMDRSRMPYTEACIMEVQRIASVIPLAVPHSTAEDISIRGYTLPKGIMVLPNLTSVLRDSKLFKNPDKFDPNNFLQDGQLHRLEEWIPFSVGRRQCPGESLAKMEIFLFLTSILQQFTIEIPEGETMPENKRYEAMIIAPPKFKMCALKR